MFVAGATVPLSNVALFRSASIGAKDSGQHRKDPNRPRTLSRLWDRHILGRRAKEEAPSDNMWLSMFLANLND